MAEQTTSSQDQEGRGKGKGWVSHYLLGGHPYSGLNGYVPLSPSPLDDSTTSQQDHPGGQALNTWTFLEDLKYTVLFNMNNCSFLSSTIHAKHCSLGSSDYQQARKW